MYELIDINDIKAIAIDAGDAVMEIYNKEFDIEYKNDNSPLTEADKKAHSIIQNSLQKLHLSNSFNSRAHPLPILSEEGRDIPYDERKEWNEYWCIDPLDGTKEFIKKNGEFTVNIALIRNGQPVLGVVYAPALQELYWAKHGYGAFKAKVTPSKNKRVANMAKIMRRIKEAHTLPIEKSKKRNSTLCIVASRSHRNEETERFIALLRSSLSKNDKEIELISRGSSLKLLMVAEGSADIYPRLAPTMEWDTAAADAIVREAGKGSYIYPYINNEQLHYNKKSLLNPNFVVR